MTDSVIGACEIVSGSVSSYSMDMVGEVTVSCTQSGVRG